MESRFFEPPGVSNHGMFPLVLLQSNTVFLPPIFRTLDFSKLSIFRTNRSCLPWRKLIRNLQLNLPWISRTCRKGLLSSFHLNGHTLGFYSQTQKLDPPFITQKTVPKKALLSAFHLKVTFWPGLSSRYLTFDLSEVLKCGY